MITPEIVTEVRNVVSDNMGLILTDAQVLEVLADQHVLGEVVQFGANDTETRSTICNFLSERIMGRRIPRYGEGIGVEFWIDLHAKAPAFGYITGGF